MPINATRFQFLDKETNVATASFKSDLDSSILNSISNVSVPSSDQLNSLIDGMRQSSEGLLSNYSDIKSQATSALGDATSSVKQMVDNTVTSIAGSDAVSSIKGVAGDIKDKASELYSDILPELPSSLTDAASSVTRLSKGLVSRINDLSKLPTSGLNNYISNISGGNPLVTKALSGVVKNCGTSGLGTGIPGKPYSPSLNCGGGKVSLGNDSGYGNYTGYGSSSCNASSYGDLLNKLTNGAYGSVFKDYNSALQAIMALASQGYKLGMCGVFNSLSGSSGLDSQGLSKAAAALLSNSAASGNTAAVLDLSKSVQGLNPLSYSPSILSSFGSNYKIPDGVGNAGLLDLADRTMAGVELLDSEWMQCETPSDFSIASFVDSGSGSTSGSRGIDWDSLPDVSDDLSQAMAVKSTERTFDELSINVAPSDNNSFAFSSFW